MHFDRTMRIYSQMDIDVHRHVDEGATFEPETVDTQSATLHLLRFGDSTGE